MKILLLTASLIVLEPPQLPAGVTCEQVRELVTQHGKMKALAWAIRHGYAWKQIKEAKRCL